MAKLKGGTRIYGDIKIDGGIYDSSNQVGVAGSVLISTGVGIAWTSSAGAGAQGVQGPQGLQGTQGPQGLQGTQGPQGLQGTQGPQGLQGTQGPQGIQGSQGPQGLQGTQGPQGLQGTQGPQGLQGAQGPQGIQGSQGPQGLQGTTGAGTQGVQGLQGTQGPQGLQGTQGPQGIQGVQGPQGLQGTQGPQGLQGTTGAGTQGVQGLQGTQGPQGLQGTQGIQGNAANVQGVQGLQGVAGAGGGGSINVVDNTTTNATYYVGYSTITGGTLSNLGISSTKLQFNPSTGTLFATVFTSLSDQTQKENVRPIEGALNIVNQMNGVYYDWIDKHNQSSVGLIAQEVEKVLPQVISTTTNGLKTVSYGNIVAVLIEAIKEQQVRIEKLEEKLNA